MSMYSLKINGRSHSMDIDPNTPLLWAIRDSAGLTGTKYGCGVAQCGACTVFVGGQTMRSCSLPVSAVGDREVTTIEGLSGREAAAVQKAWVGLDVPQCGYCQSGQIMKAAELLAGNPKPSRDQIIAHMDGNICRCGTYPRIVAAVERAAREG
jgi:isoquinoline 1-oxidoreductase subunit alpha